MNAAERAEKETRQKVRECFEGTRTHIRCGWWHGEPVNAVTFIGHAKDLHGTVCTCCPRREEAP